MTTHTLPSSPTQPCFDRDAAPRLTVDSGDTIVFDCPEPCGQVTPQWTARDVAERWDKSKVHALLGPVEVRGSRAGGSLDVEILAIEHHGWGWSALIPGFGLLHERFPEAYLHHWTLTDRGCELGRDDIVVPCDPFVGCIGVAPPEKGRLDTIPPRVNGGNLDVRDTVVGSTVRLPVFQDGVGLQIGDGHAAQGDGELCGTAIEAPLRITVRVNALPDTPSDGIHIAAPPRPALSEPGPHHVTLGIGPDPRDATRDAANRMLDHLVATYALPEELAMILCSAAGRMRIAQAVNEPNWTIALSLPLSLFPSR
jgi:acetamidase/formamidase